MTKENEESFLENLALNMIASANTEHGKLPFEGMEFDCTRGNAWSISGEIKPDLAQIFKYNFHYLRFTGTKMPADLPKEIADFYYGQRFMPNIEPNPPQEEWSLNYMVDTRMRVPDFLITTIYDRNYYSIEQGMKLSIEPSSGDVVKAINAGIPLFGACFKIYHHFYTVEFPIMFQITDLNDKDDPFVFNFATPVMIDKNEPARKKTPYSDDSFMSITSNDYCAQSKYPVTVRVQDRDGRYLPGVSIDYTCLRFSCHIGETQRDIPFARLVADFPFCINGRIIAKKDGYLQREEVFTSSSDGKGEQLIMLSPLKMLEYSFLIYRDDATATPIASDESVIMTIKAANKRKEEHEITIYFPSEVDSFKTLEVLDDDVTYEVDIKLVKNDVVVGGFVKNWTVKRSLLIGKNRVIFPVITSWSPPEKMEDFAEFWVGEVMRRSKGMEVVLG